MAARVFEATVLPHLDAAFNFARWLTSSLPCVESDTTEGMVL